MVSIDLGSSTFKLPPPSNGASKLFGDENPPSKGYNDDTSAKKICFLFLHWMVAAPICFKHKVGISFPKKENHWYTSCPFLLDGRIIPSMLSMLPRKAFHCLQALVELISIHQRPNQALGPIQGHKVQHWLVTLGGLKRFFLVQPWALVWIKPLGLISTFVPIGMLNLGWTSALTPSVNWA